MKRFEDELRWAMQRREPPAGFADRVMARIPTAPPRRSWFNRLSGGVSPRFRWAPVAATVLIAAFTAGSYEYRQMQQRREGERAKQELIFALQVTSTKLQSTRTKLLETMGGSL